MNNPANNEDGNTVDGRIPVRIRAAGAVLWRQNEANKQVEIALVHRPRYDDWSLPKGKVEPGEAVAVAAIREVLEETGFSSVLGPRLGTVEYEIDVANKSKVSKSVEYFSAQALDGRFEISEEVDKVLWLSPEEAETELSQKDDKKIIQAFRALPSHLHTVVLVRHAKAGKRENWQGDDNARPLSPAGLRQADAIAQLVAIFRPARVYSAPRSRCRETVQAVAEEATVDIQEEYLFSEEGYRDNREFGQARLLEIAKYPGTSVVSSQGGVIPDLITQLANQSGLSLDPPASDLATSATEHSAYLKKWQVRSKKGSLWVLFFAVNVEGKPTMIAADYYPTALPNPHRSRPDWPETKANITIQQHQQR